MNTKYIVRETSIYLPGGAGGFDVSGCPDALALARTIGDALNAWQAARSTPKHGDDTGGLSACVTCGAPSVEPAPTAKQRFDAAMADEQESPLERLRFFCSLAMGAQDWLDAEPFFAALSAPQQVEPGWVSEVENYLVAAAAGSMSRNNSEALADELLQLIRSPKELKP